MMHRDLRWLVLLVLSCLVCFGCAKKQITPQATPPASQESMQYDQNGMQTGMDQAVEAKEAAQELRERQLMEEQRANEERARQEAMVVETVQRLENDRIYFDFDSFELKPQSRTILQNKAELLKQMPDLKLRIEGHCDERGTDEYNLALGEKRARVAYEFLILLGVEPQRLQIISYGEEYPADPGHNETAWALNRRDEFKVFK
ncbi:peptidoglycan-associated lipoprotein Pal [Desulfoplanes formicivorans]|uniref:Peptidoglycan-associated protein n=1 Tax=Desulfoplanes formicivorans TaxID=1592317 RepID=A0A194AL61_9BACT|nr:peptidoglycan-associated lipoprotein Pal [Desulfoplanes formicivorans]GAU09776.1 peptidoglycan-associated lipoprotein [Desulfoplanes formicivorans]